MKDMIFQAAVDCKGVYTASLSCSSIAVQSQTLGIVAFQNIGVYSMRSKDLSELQQDIGWIRKYIQRLNEPAVGIFDIGTRAARLLVAPKRIPDVWQRGTFRNSGYAFNVGIDVPLDKDELSLDAASLADLCFFLRTHSENLKSLGVDDISAIGTAVFRWLSPDSHKKEVLDAIERASGVKIEVIDHHEEARLTLLGMPEILLRAGGAEHIRDDDTIIVFDQGGGSLEVSWMRWGDRHLRKPPLATLLHPSLGSIALRRQFFNSNADGAPVLPERNMSVIANKIRKMSDNARSEVMALLRGVPRYNAAGGSRLYAFGLGTALTKGLWPNHSGWQLHNGSATPDDLAVALEKRMGVLGASKQRVVTAWKALYDKKGSGVERLETWDNLDRDLVVLWGLPVFREVMLKCQLTELRVSGYALRHGYYIEKYLRGPKPIAQPDDSGPYIFASYAHADKAIVYPEIAFLQSLGFRVWYDPGIVGGSTIHDTIPRQIDQSCAFVVFMSEDAASSDEVYREVFRALQHKPKKPVLQIRIRRTTLPPRLAHLLDPQLYLDRQAEGDESYAEKVTAALPDSCRVA